MTPPKKPKKPKAPAKRKPKADPDAPRALTKAERDEWNRLHKLRAPVDEVAISPAQRRAFLDLVERDKSIGTVAALREVGVAGTKGQLAAFVDADDELAVEIRDARGYGDDRIRAAIVKRAIDGVEELAYVTKDGDPVYRTVYSDRLLALLAKAQLPEYRDISRVEHTGAGGGPVEVGNPDVAAAIDRFTANINRIAARAAGLEPGGDVRALERAAAELPPGKPGG